MAGGDLSIYPSQEVHVPKGPLRASKRASTFFLSWRGSFFFTFFFLGSRGGTCSSSSRRKSVLVLFISGFFWRGRFWCCCCCWVLLGFLSSPFFRGRASLEEGLEEERKERKAVRYKVYFLTIFFRPRREKREGREKETRTFGEVGRKVLVFFCIYIFLCFIYIYIYII